MIPPAPDFRAEFSAASLKPNLTYTLQLTNSHFRAEFSAASLKPAWDAVPGVARQHFRAEFSAASLKPIAVLAMRTYCWISALNSARPH